MNPGRILRDSRRKAGLSQRELSGLSRVAQPAIARLESGRVTPRADLLDRLLAACGFVLEPMPRPGQGVDTTGMIENLTLTPHGRILRAAADWNGLRRFLEEAHLD